MHRPQHSYSKIAVFIRSRAEEKTRKTDTLRAIMKKGAKIKTELHKRDKTTEILFDDASSIVEILTHNTELKKRLSAYAAEYPDLCKLTDEDEETDYKSFEIFKRRFSIRLTAPYSVERRKAASEAAKKQNFSKAHTQIESSHSQT